MLRARLSLFALEGRENPSVPGIDPVVIAGTPSTDPVVTQPAPVSTTIIDIGTVIVAGAGDTGTTTTSTSSLGATDPLFVLPNP